MKKLPASSTLAKKVLATSTGKGRTLASSSSYLTSKSQELKKYRGVEDFVTAPDDDQPQLRKAVEHHLRLLRAQLARELWSRQLFIGVSVLDDLLFRAVVEGARDPVLRTIQLIRDNKLHHPGFVVFPVHTFGVLGAGLLHFFTKARVEFTSKDFGLVLGPQTNSLKGTLALLDRARQAFGIRKKVPVDLVEHWYQSRSATWLIRNPLLIVKTQSFSGGYYENQFLLVNKLRQVATLVAMLATLQPNREERGERLFSSSSLNNYQTLDIRHYIMLFNAPRRAKLTGDCVPVHLSAPAFAELSNLGVELDPRHWQRRKGVTDRIHNAMNTVYSGYIRYCVSAEEESVHGRVYRKLFDSTSYFRRSFHRSDMNWSAVVSLAVAFEMLLTDTYAPNVKARVIRRTRKLLQGVRGVRRFTKAVEDLSTARGAIVHTGSTQTKVDLHDARRAFVHAFVAIAEVLPSLAASTQSPMKDLCGDSKA